MSARQVFHLIMSGLVPGIHVLSKAAFRDVDGRDIQA